MIKNNGLFPFKSVRKGQEEVLRDARKVLREGKHLLANAPTGLGKTVVALTASLEVAAEEKKLVMFLTSRQSQHKAAIDTVLLMNRVGAKVGAVDVISKQMMCQLPESRRFKKAFYEYCNLKVRTKSCPWHARDMEAVADIIAGRTMHVHDLINTCRRFGVCPHRTALLAATRSNVLVCDYNYIFSDMREQVLKSIDKRLADIILIVDEAHNLPERIRSHLCGDLSPGELRRGIKESKKYNTSLSRILRSILTSFQRLFSDAEKEELVERAEFLDSVKKAMRRVSGQRADTEELIFELEEVGERVLTDGGSSTLMEIADFLRNWRKMDEVMVRILTHGKNKKLSYKLLDPSVLSEPVFKEVHSSIMMSGTLHPVAMYRDLLGLESDRTVMGNYASPFPRDNRLIVVTPHLTSLYSRRGDAMYSLYAKEIMKIADQLPGNMAVFYPSYNFLEEIRKRMSHWERKLILQEKSRMTKEEKTGLLKKLRTLKNKGGALLMGVLGGSLSEGIDFRDNLLYSVVVVGLPLSPPCIENKALRNYYSEKFGPRKGFEYSLIYPALNKVLQAAGRCIRCETDKAIIFLMDSRYALERYSSCMPKDFDFMVSSDVEERVSDFCIRVLKTNEVCGVQAA